MASYDFTNGSIEGQMVPRRAAAEENEVFIRRNIVDFSKQNLTTSDDAKVLEIEEGLIVKSVYGRIITADSGGGTIDFGKTASGHEWGDNQAVATQGAIIGGTRSLQYYDADGYVYVTGVATASITTLKLEVLAECVKALDKI